MEAPAPARRALRALLLAAAVVAAGALFFGRGGGPVAERSGAPASPREATGQLADGDRPALALTDLGGRRRTLEELRGRVVLVNVWASWCPPCREEMPSLERLWRSGEVAVLAISVDERRADAERVVKDFSLTMPVVLDPGGALAASWGTVKYPETWILDAQGAVAGRIIGPRDWDAPEVRETLRNLR